MKATEPDSTNNALLRSLDKLSIDDDSMSLPADLLEKLRYKSAGDDIKTVLGGFIHN